MRTEVRIVLLGDEGSGKSSLITQAVHQRFEDRPTQLLPEVTLPPDVTSEHTTLHIIDTCSTADHRQDLEERVKSAHVLLVVYSVVDQASFDRLSSYWLPEIRKLRNGLESAPILLVGNKIDLRKEEEELDLEKFVAPVMNEYKEVETCIECSAKSGSNVAEMFHFAQKAVLYPTGPVFDANQQKLKPECVKALQRVFKLCDKDKDDLLNDEELNEFQTRCFDTPLQKDELDRVKEVVRDSAAEGIKDNSLTLLGFLFLHHLFIQKGRIETTWAVLRSFGYEDDLSLSPDFLLPPLNVEPGQVVELNATGHEFLRELFKAFDKDHDGVLSRADLDKLFETSPEGNLWSHTPYNIVNSLNSVTESQFLVLWQLVTSQDYQTTLKFLAYLGYPGDQTDAVTVGSVKAERKKKRLLRTVLQVFAFGTPGSGKTALLEHIAEKQPGGYTKTDKRTVAANTFGNKGKTLVLVEFGQGNEKAVRNSPAEMDRCDMAVLVFDVNDPQSVTYVQDVCKELQALDNPIPCLFVGTKKDQQTSSSKAATIVEFCKTNNLPEPVIVSLKDTNQDALFTALANTALSPFTAGTSPSSGWGLKLGLAGLVVAVGAGAAWWWFGRKSTPTPKSS